MTKKQETEETQKFPYMLEVGISMYGRTIPIWVYNKVPQGMRRATSMSDFWNGRHFLYKSRLSEPDRYVTEIFRPSCRSAVEQALKDGAEIYIKE